MGFEGVTRYMVRPRLWRGKCNGGANAVQGVEATVWQLRLAWIQPVPETPNNVILRWMKALAIADDVPEIRPEQLMDADGTCWQACWYLLVYWFPWGRAGAHCLAHHGLIFVPLGCTFSSGMFEMNEVKGGSSYGAGT
ncbi:hypothetical protein DITRI_Ditri14bG0057800 [Diplodiscus trichospermus]